MGLHNPSPKNLLTKQKSTQQGGDLNMIYKLNFKPEYKAKAENYAWSLIGIKQFSPNWKTRREIKVLQAKYWTTLGLLAFTVAGTLPYIMNDWKRNSEAVFISPEATGPVHVIEVEVEPKGTSWTIEGNTDIAKIISSDKGWVENLITQAANKYGVSDTLMQAIAQCESGFRPTAKNPHSTATGVFQFIKATWLGFVKQRGLDWTLEDRIDPVKNIDMAAYVISKGGLHNWKADPKSYACWGWAEFK